MSVADQSIRSLLEVQALSYADRQSLPWAALQKATTSLTSARMSSAVASVVVKASVSGTAPMPAGERESRNVVVVDWWLASSKSTPPHASRPSHGAPESERFNRKNPPDATYHSMQRS